MKILTKMIIIVNLLILFFPRPGNSRTTMADPLIKDDFLVNDDLGVNYQGQPAMAFDLNANFVICWTDRRNRSNDIYAQMFEADGTPIGANFRVNDDSGTANQLQPRIARDNNGRFVIVWLDYREGSAHVYAQRYADNGTPLGSNFRVDAQQRLEYTRRDPVISIQQAGNFVIAWREYASYHYIFAQRYEKDGTALGENIPVSGISSSKSSLSIGMDNDENFYVCYLQVDGTNSDIRIRKYNPDGNFLFQVFPGETGRKSGWDRPVIIAKGAGDFSVAWQQVKDNNYNDWDIYAQRFNTDGTSNGTWFRVSDNVALNQKNPDIHVGNAGTFIVAWEDDRNGNTDIFAQRFLADGRVSGSNYQINSDSTVTTQSAVDLRIVMGNVYFCWTDNRDVNRSSDIYCQIESWGKLDNITVQSPNGGEMWLTDQTYPVTWKSSGVSGNVRIQFSGTGGPPFLTIKNEIENTGEWEWTPQADHISNNCLIKIVSLENQAISDQSDAPFRIVDRIPKATYNAPKIPSIIPLPVLDGKIDEPFWAQAPEAALLFGESWETPWINFADNRVTWRAAWSAVSNRLYVAVTVQDDIRGTFDNNDPAKPPYQPWHDDSIEFYTDGNDDGGDYEFRYDRAQQWRVSGENKRTLMNFPTAANPQFYTGKDFVTAIQTQPGTGNWTCEAAFAIYNNYPDDPKILRTGETIGWEVRYCDSDDADWSGSYFRRDHFTGWTFSGPAAINADYFGALVLQPEPPTIRITSPNGAENINCTWPITWTAWSVSDLVKIEYFCDNAWHVLTDEAPNTGTYVWSIPGGVQCAQCKIRISDAQNPGLNDESDAFFSVDCRTCDSPSLQVANVRGLPGDTVMVAIQIDGNPAAINALGFNFIYEKDYLLFDRLEKDALTTNFTVFEANQKEAGNIRIGGYSATPIPANSTGAIAWIYLVVQNCQRGASCPLQIQDLVDDVIGFNVCNGYFDCLAQCMLGDVNLDELLTPGDALCAFQIYMNSGVPPEGKCRNECSLSAADATCDGEITPGDALTIFSAYLRNAPLPLECPAHFPANEPPAVAELRLEQITTHFSDEVLQIAVNINPSGNLQAFGLEVHFPEEALQFSEVIPGELTADWYAFSALEKQSGIIRIAGFDPAGIANNNTDILMKIGFKIHATSQSPVMIRLADLKDDLAAAKSTPLEINLPEAEVFLENNAGVPEQFELKQNFPNPFNAETIIEYALPQPGHVRIEIFDLTGKNVKTLLDVNQSAAQYRIIWDGLSMAQKPVPSGIYYIRMQAGEFVKMIQAVLIR